MDRGNIKTVEVIQKTREYLDYLEDHINNVGRAWKELQDKCKGMSFVYDDFIWAHIDQDIEEHDLSKLSEAEFVQYRKSFYPHENEEKFDMSGAWENHKANNPHHWQNWGAKKYSDPFAWQINCVCMVIDWMAMGYKFGDTARKYYESNDSKIDIPDYAVKFIYEIFERLEAPA